MKIDSAIQAFSEKYDRAAIQSIEHISKDIGLNANRNTIKGINLVESFSKFDEFLKGYAQYKVENINNPEASDQKTIRSNFDRFIEGALFEESRILYSDLPAFVKGYVEGVQSLLETVDTVKGTMMEHDVAQEAVGDVNDFVDHFMVKLQESFDPVMNRILWASGYNAHQRLMKKEVVQPKPVVFL